MSKRFEKDNFIYIINEGVFNRLAQAVTGIGRKITQPPPEPTMLKTWTRKSKYPKKGETRRITPLNPATPEHKAGMGGTLLMSPDLVKRIWPAKRIEQQQKEFFINVFSKDEQSIAILKKGIDPIFCGTSNVTLTKNEFEQFDSAIFQFVNAGVLGKEYGDLSKRVYQIHFGKKDSEEDYKKPIKSDELSDFCKNIKENKALYASLLELGPSSQGLGSYDERNDIYSSIDRAEDSGFLNISDNIDSCDDNYDYYDEQEDLDSKISP